MSVYDDWSEEVIEKSHNLRDSDVIRLLDMMDFLRDYDGEALRNVLRIKDKINSFFISKSCDDLRCVKDLWDSFDHGDQGKIWIAPSKGGVFTTEERIFIKDNL